MGQRPEPVKYDFDAAGKLVPWHLARKSQQAVNPTETMQEASNETADVDLDNSAPQSTRTEQGRILEALQAASTPISPKDLAANTSVPVERLSKTLQWLAKNGEIQRPARCLYSTLL